MTNFEAIKAMDEYQIIKYFGAAICDRFVYNHDNPELLEVS